MTDLSKVFKSTVKAIRLNLGQKSDLNEELGLIKKDKNNKKNGNIETKTDANNIITSITKLKAYLIENKHYYIQPDYLISNQSDGINDYDRQSFEDTTENIIHTCNSALRQFHENALSKNLSQQRRNHLENLYSIIDKYLKDVCKLYAQQKAVQVQRAIEKKNFAQLCTPSILKDTGSINSSNKHANNDENDGGEDKKIKKQTNLNPNEFETKNDLFETQLSNEEIQIFEEENKNLYKNLTELSQEIKQVESQVIEISRLQQVFTEKILEQDYTISDIQVNAIKTSDNIKMGNEEIEEAMKNNRSLRLWILFIVIVLSFTLLFLDWYND